MRGLLRGTGRPAQADLLILCHQRRVMEDGLYTCIYTDALAEHYRSVTLEHPHNGQHLTPARTKNLIYTDAIVIRGNLYSRFHRRFRTPRYRHLYRTVRERLKQPLREMEEAYSVSLDKTGICRLMVERILNYQREYRLYRRLAERIRPKLIVEVVHYGMQCMIFNQLGKELHIPTVELQHGTMSSEHVAYQYAGNGTLPQLPEYLFTFSDFWNGIAHLPEASTRLIAVGYPYFERQVAKYRDSAMRDETVRTILFVSQGTIGAKMSQLAVDLHQRLDAEHWRIIYKLHPGEYPDWRREYPWLAESGMEVVDTAERNVYEYFAISDVQIGVSSTAIYEGLPFGLDTYLYRLPSSEGMQPLVDRGYARMFDDVEELIGMLSGERADAKAPQAFWKEHAWENMIREIERLLRESA